VLQHTTATRWQHTATHCNTLLRTPLATRRCVGVTTHHGNIFATLCNTLQHTSSHSTCNRWSSWQCVAVCCSVLLMCCRGALRHLHNCVLQVEFVAVCCSVAGGVHGYGEQYTYIAHGNTMQHIPDTQRTHIVRVPLLSSTGGVRGFRERCRASSLGCWCVCV